MGDGVVLLELKLPFLERLTEIESLTILRSWEFLWGFGGRGGNLWSGTGEGVRGGNGRGGEQGGVAGV